MAEYLKNNMSTADEGDSPGAARLPGLGLSALAASFIIILAAVFPFLNILQNNFVRYDDTRFILENKIIRELSVSNVLHIMSAYSPDSEDPEPCPLTRVTWAVNYRLHGYDHRGFQAGNIIFHALSCVLLLFLLRAGPWGAATAFWGALLFAVHPVHVESVTWMTARKDVLSAAFTFASMIAYLRFVKSRRPCEIISFWFFSMLLWVAAVYAKPNAVTTPALLALWVICFIPKENRLKGLAALLPAFAAIAYFTWAQVNILVHYDSIREFAGGSFWTAQFTNANILLRYLFNMAAPVLLNVEYWVPPPKGWLDPQYLWSWAALLPAAASYIYFSRRNFSLLFFPAWFLIALAPVLQFVPTSSKMADRYLYIPSVAFCLFIALAAGLCVKKLSPRLKTAPALFALSLVAVTLLLAALTFQRNTVWRDDAALFLDSLRKNPNSSHAANNLGNIFLEQGRLDEAERLLRKSLENSQEKYVPLTNLGALYMQKKDYAQALKYFSDAAVLKPNSPKLLWNIVHANIANNDMAGAALAADAYFAVKPEDVESRGVLCRSLGDKLFYKAALPHCRAYIDSKPADSRILWTYAGGLFETGDFRKAITVYKYFIDSFSGNPGPAYVNVGICLYMIGETELAAATWREARRIDVGNERAYQYLNNTELLDKMKTDMGIHGDIIRDVPEKLIPQGAQGP